MSASTKPAVAPEIAEPKKRRRGRPKATGISVAAQKQISALKIRLGLPAAVLTYRDAASELTDRAGFTVSAAAVWDYCHGHEPRVARLRKVFGLPVLHLAPACPGCGDVHLAKRCPNAPKRAGPKRWQPTKADVQAAYFAGARAALAVTR